jgi:imidazolonepropionase-like amidohydrolase
MTDASETPDPVEVADETSVAFVGVNVVPMDAERILRDQTVMVRGGRIVELGPLASVDVPEDAIQISGRGRYLMPGLADMHVHLWWHGWSPLYVANGVTTLRVMQGDESTLNMQRGAVEHDMPTIHSAGPLIEGEHPPHDWPEGWHPLSSPALVRTAEEGREAVRRTQEAGFQFVKVHNFLRSEAYAAIVAAAEEAGLPVVGHVPEGGIGAVLEARQSSVEHLFGYLLAAQAPGSPAHRSATYFSSWRLGGPDKKTSHDQRRATSPGDSSIAGTLPNMARCQQSPTRP